jgi:hypothetical protein
VRGRYSGRNSVSHTRSNIKISPALMTLFPVECNATSSTTTNPASSDVGLLAALKVGSEVGLLV